MGLDDNFYFLTTKFFSIAEKYLEVKSFCKDYGAGFELYPSEIHMVVLISDHPGINITMIAAKLGITKGAVSQMIKKLEDKGLVQRYKSPDNRKEVMVRLTDSGRIANQNHGKDKKEFDMPIIDELKKMSEEKLDFLKYVFAWLDDYMDEACRHFKAGKGEKK